VTVKHTLLTWIFHSPLKPDTAPTDSLQTLTEGYTDKLTDFGRVQSDVTALN